MEDKNVTSLSENLDEFSELLSANNGPMSPTARGMASAAVCIMAIHASLLEETAREMWAYMDKWLDEEPTYKRTIDVRQFMDRLKALGVTFDD